MGVVFCPSFHALRTSERATRRRRPTPNLSFDKALEAFGNSRLFYTGSTRPIDHVKISRLASLKGIGLRPRLAPIISSRAMAFSYPAHFRHSLVPSNRCERALFAVLEGPGVDLPKSD
jgi:hypothetical protein